MLLKTNIKYVAGAFICALLFVSHPVNMFAQPADFTGKTSEWDGCRRYDFTVSGRNAIVVVPQKAAKGNPWIWRPAFFGAFPSVDKALLKKGFHVVYFDVTHLYGSPRSVLLGNDFYVEMTHRWGLSPNVTLEGFSRGGYFAFNWAAENTDKIACLYVDAPVCNIESWPSRKRTQLWSDFLKEWGITDSEVDDNFRGNALNKLSSLYAARIPIIAVCGDSDKTVPYEENMKKVYDAYKKMGGKVKLIVKHGCDHHPHSLTNPEPIVKFIMRHQKSNHIR
jgi:pimeloyl-ACP methyl ester carboxylesterase